MPDTIDRSGCTAPKHGNLHNYDHNHCRCPDAIDAHNRRYRRKLAGIPSDYRVGITGSRRRLRALEARGWPVDVQAARIGISKNTVARIIGGHDDSTDTNDMVSRDIAAKIATVYDEISGLDGPSPVTARRSLLRGYAPPWYWTNLDIDDPDAGWLDADPDAADAADSGDEGDDRDHVIVIERAIMAVARADKTWAPKLSREERHTVVTELHRRGWNPKVIAAGLGVTERTINRDWAELGLAQRIRFHVLDHRTREELGTVHMTVDEYSKIPRKTSKSGHASSIDVNGARYQVVDGSWFWTSGEMVGNLYVA